MAQLKDLIVNSDARIIGTLYVDKHNINTLQNTYTQATRPTDCNTAIAKDGSGCLRHFKSTSAMTANGPGFEGHVLHFNWDNDGGYESQLALGYGAKGIKFRGQTGGNWSAWYTVLHNGNYTNYTPVVHTGSGTPASGTGKNGDIYIQV